MKVETVDVDSLHPHPRNYREHPPDQLAHIVQSIKEHGFYRNVVVANDGTILAGHGVVKAAREMGLAQVPILRLDVGQNDVKALKILAGDNEISNLGEKDDRGLSEMLKEILQQDVNGLLGTGFDSKMLANLVFVTRPESEIQDFDAAAKWVGVPAFEQGKVYPTLTIKFETVELRDELLRKIEVATIHKKVGEAWAIWWPERPKDDLAAVRFE